MKDPTFNNNETTLQRMNEFPEQLVPLYFIRSTNKYNADKINAIFKEHRPSCNKPEDYMPLIQSELIPKISNHIIKIIQSRSQSKKN